MNNASFTVAVRGPDNWLRPMLCRRLTVAGAIVREFGTGTAQISDVDALVYIPAMMPMSTSPAKDVGAAAAAMTFMAAANGNVPHVALVSRVGLDASDPYLRALRALERSAMTVGRKVTVVRATHPVGELSDPGPFVTALVRHHDVLRDGADPRVQPVGVDDLVDVITAAVDGRIGAGFVEVGGATSTLLSDFEALVTKAHPVVVGRSSRPGLLTWLKPRAHRTRGAIANFLAQDSVADPKLASPLGTRRRDLDAIWEDPKRAVIR